MDTQTNLLYSILQLFRMQATLKLIGEDLRWGGGGAWGCDLGRPERLT